MKGGFLISSLIGIENRTTMDMDTTIKGIAIKEERIKEIVQEIINISIDDGIKFEIKDISYIREEDEYENFRVSLIANVGKTKNPMKLDLTTGEAITPREIEYTYPCIFSKEAIKNNGIYIKNNFSRKIRNHNQEKYNDNTNERLVRPMHPLQAKKRPDRL
ncbi:nucleotidyl transferase AbiEii/AbiGii toxin family protein [Sneathia sanguinegens]|uniref:nucleotidyl transferase AbiEii/AbiGii toxin family protein n=1 Tax=Sneathia sanguinegens TaxID=40543 RepID=UPI0023F7E389|nr:nucleotidyl transferase AbiEii/AbiGii toxin family protein [Sneathia sanguinegens]